MTSLPLYAPKDRDMAPDNLCRGSAILRVGLLLRVAPRKSARESFGDVCRLAAERGAPLDPNLVELAEVGWFDDTEGVVRLRPGCDKLLAAWIGQVPYRNTLEASDSRHIERQRARRDFRKAYMQGNTMRASRVASKHNIRDW